MKKSEYPILEFDDTKAAMIEATEYVEPQDDYNYCVITFFRDALEKMKKNNEIREVASIYSETTDIPIYEIDYKGQKMHLTKGYMGAPGSAALLEKLIAYGFDKFIVCGGVGVLKKDIAVGHLIIPISAVRDEGLSYHYLKPAREVEADNDVIKVIEDDLSENNIDYIKAKTWTTDAFFRETKKKVDLRKSEGCVTVDMESAALFAVSKFRNVKLGHIFYGGDDLSGVEWNEREWKNKKSIRYNLVQTALRICSKL